MAGSPYYIIYLVASFSTRNRPGFLSIYIGHKNHIGAVYSSYNNSPEVGCSN